VLESPLALAAAAEGLPGASSRNSQLRIWCRGMAGISCPARSSPRCLQGRHTRAGPRSGFAASHTLGWVTRDGRAPRAAENSQYVLSAPGMMLWLSILQRWSSLPWHFNHAFLSLLLGGTSSPGSSLPGDRNGRSPPTSAAGWGFLGPFPTRIAAQARVKVSFCCSSPAASRCGGCTGAGAACPVYTALPRVMCQ